jgi:hypothetical protein
MSGDLWQEVMSEFDKYFPKQTADIRPLMERLGETGKQPNDLLEPLFSLIDMLAKE